MSNVAQFPTAKNPANPDADEIDAQIEWLTDFRNRILAGMPEDDILTKLGAAIVVLKKQKERATSGG